MVIIYTFISFWITFSPTFFPEKKMSIFEGKKIQPKMLFEKF